ncbi:MAG TPA: N-acetylmuramoyl-L-alanine amidase [Prevotella sp.]|nr:N-acetylmuramoyl-L-alanine amidase [Prevotella sp.]
MKTYRYFSLFLFLLVALALPAANQRFTLVIDAGHGGKDHGAPGAISEEKNLTLKYALAFGKLVEDNCPDVRVIYTRKTDTYLTLHERAEVANRNNADLFISIHINALDGVHTAHGFQSYTLGRGETTGDKGLKVNADVAKRENSVIFLENNYKTVYANLNGNAPELDIMGEIIADQNRERSVKLSRFMQQEVCKATGRQDGGSHQNNLAVLRLTKMPAILLELGFISTPDEENYMNTEEGYNQYPRGFFNAFMRYREKYDNSIDVPYRSGAEVRKTAPLEPVAEVKGTEKRPAAERAVADPPRRQSAVARRETVPARKETASVRKETVTVRKETASVRKEPAPTTKKATDETRPVFKIQILVSNSVLKANDPHLKGLTGCGYYVDGQHKKYTYGASNDYNEIYRLRKQIVDKFPEAFIIAFKNGKKGDVNEGIREFKQNRKAGK